MMNVVHPSFTENVSKYDTQITFTRINIYFLLSPNKKMKLEFVCLIAKVVVRVNSFDTGALFSNCLGMNYYVNFLGGIGSNGFHRNSILWLSGLNPA